MNTTRLIRHWSMEGAVNDIQHDFGSAVDIHAAVSERPGEPAATPAAESAAGLLVKPAGGGDWQPLLAGSA
jgi:hypothetical protein